MDPVTLALALAQFAPSLMRFFGAGDKPVAVAQKAVEIALSVTGAGDGPGALAALRGDPALAQQYALALLAQDGDLERAYLADRADARARDVEIVRTGRRNVRADLMVLLDVVGLVVCLVVLVALRDKLPGEAVGIIATIAGVFGACLRDAHQFEFGSSRGSREKDDALARAVAR